MDTTELRQLAEDLSDLDGAWGTEKSGLLEGYTAVRQGKHIIVAHCFRDEVASFIAAASPDVVLGLLDRLDAWNEGTASACARAMVKTARDFQAERDEAREAVGVLVEALEAAYTEEWASAPPTYGWGELARAALANPVVTRYRSSPSPQ